MSRLFITLAALALGALGVFVIAKNFGKDPHEVPFKLVGTPAPGFVMKKLGAPGEVRFSDLAGKPVVLNFWATWCEPCKMEHPVIEWGARNYGDRVEFLGIVFEDTEENTTRFLAERPSPFTQLYDPKSTVAVDYGVTGVPETYFINRTGIIVGKYAAPIPPQELKRRLEEILQ